MASRSTATSSPPQGSSGRLLAPTSPGRPPARDRRPGPRDCAADHAVRRPVSVQVPRARRSRNRLHGHRFAGRASAGAHQHQACQGSRQSIGSTSACEDGRPFGRRERRAPSPARPGTGEPRAGAKWCFLRSQWRHEDLAWARHGFFRRLELIEPSNDKNAGQTGDAESAGPWAAMDGKSNPNARRIVASPVTCTSASLLVSFIAQLNVTLRHCTAPRIGAVTTDRPRGRGCRSRSPYGDGATTRGRRLSQGRGPRAVRPPAMRLLAPEGHHRG